MRLATYRQCGDRRIGVVVDSRVYDVRAGFDAVLARRDVPDRSALVQALVPTDMTRFIEIGDAAVAAAREVIGLVESDPVRAAAFGQPFSEALLDAPVPRPSAIFCVVDNNHELVNNADYVPPYPIYFSKPRNALLGHGRPLELPDIGIIHPESELAVVIGRKASRIKAEEAYDHIFGYTILNDVTSVKFRHDDAAKVRIPMLNPETGEPDFEYLVFTPVARHKGVDGFAPMGPWLVTRDEVPEPHSLGVEAYLGDRLVNRDNTANLRFHIPQILEHISAWHTLVPGDIVTLGTASSTKEWPMREADMNRLGGPVRIVFERIGTLENPVVRSADRVS